MVKKKSRTEKQPDRNYRDAGEISPEHHDNVHLGAAGKVDSALKRLKLPRLVDVEKAFFSLTDKLGVEHGGRGARQHRGANPPRPSRLGKKSPARNANARRELGPQPRAGNKSAERTAREAESKKSRKNPTRSRSKKRSTDKKIHEGGKVHPRRKGEIKMTERGSSSSHGGSQHPSKTTTDRETIRRWAEERGGKPACVQGTGGHDDIGMIRLEFPRAPQSKDDSLQEISWDEFFEKFEESNLALVYQDRTSDGQRSNFNKLVSRKKAA